MRVDRVAHKLGAEFFIEYDDTVAEGADCKARFYSVGAVGMSLMVKFYHGTNFLFEFPPGRLDNRQPIVLAKILVELDILIPGIPLAYSSDTPASTAIAAHRERGATKEEAEARFGVKFTDEAVPKVAISNIAVKIKGGFQRGD